MYLNVIVCCCLGFVAFSMRPTWLRDIRQVYNQETMSLLPSISVLSLVFLSRSSRAIDVRRLHAKDVTTTDPCNTLHQLSAGRVPGLDRTAVASC